MKITNNQFNTVVVFGDSNSDTGNIYNLTGKQFPGSPYYLGRFSNGPVWIEQLNISNLHNYAHGAATTDNDFIQGSLRPLIPSVPGARQQFQIYKNDLNASDAEFQNTLYILWAGGNDYLVNNTVDLLRIVDSLLNVVNDLIAFGAKHMIIFNQPPMEITPYFQMSSSNVSLVNLTHDYNDYLLNQVTKLQQDNPGRFLRVFDLHAFMSKTLSNAADHELNYTNVPCWNSSSLPNSACSNQEAYVFFDEVHFTTRIHGLIADEFRSFLTITSQGNRSLISILVICIWILTFSHYKFF